ncbi:hypothetical protein EW145_g351 [Phellinidium pouzarii]|uniref:Uncharacterized protein n=1 Tax=Phellinidium pouzarii TaxID=167371 RepID=A0A4S4LIS3_9AGAM|nr:hypothetical protein EW145_g351 [Phellinidium pouzarii]
MPPNTSDINQVALLKAYEEAFKFKLNLNHTVDLKNEWSFTAMYKGKQVYATTADLKLDGGVDQYEVKTALEELEKSEVRNQLGLSSNDPGPQEWLRSQTRD